MRAPGAPFQFHVPWSKMSKTETSTATLAWLYVRIQSNVYDQSKVYDPSKEIYFLFTKHVSHPSGQNASAFAGRDGGRSRLGAGGAGALDVAILARQSGDAPNGTPIAIA